ncbi:MAG: N-6 DNA methylase, partial [Ignavibacteria bacterium]|nr:N-6 DNA methylase [Ignavibacteria bacterium]
INALNRIKPDAIYCFNNQPYILFFDLVNNDLDESEIHKSIWNFNQTPVVFFIKHNQVEIYNGFVFDRDNSLLEILATENELDNFNFWEIQTSKLWINYKNKFTNSSRVDYYLLDNIKQARKQLLDNGLKSNPELVNSLIGRLIFTRYLIDRNVDVSEEFICGKNKKQKNSSFLELIVEKEKLYDFFDYLKTKFNGDLFPIKNNEKNLIKKPHLDLLQALFSGAKIFEEGIQHSLFDIYDFEIIPVELISNIYESFIGEKLQLENKAFYTPPFLVDYILSETVDKHLARNDKANCKTLDPSCGSGIFLVETLRRIIEHEKIHNPDFNKNTLKKLIKENIFGIDKDENAINVAIFSLYITLFDYQQPRDIEKFKFPELKDKNFFKADFFDTEASYNEIFYKLSEQGLSFDFIIGNPPWGNVKHGNHLEYTKTRGIPISDNQIAQSFLVRVKDFCDQNTKMALVVTSKVLYNLQAKNFRQYLLERFHLYKVLELSAVRKQIFENVIGPACIIFYKFISDKNKNTDRYNTEHISLKPNLFLKYFKTIVIEKYDSKLISQYYLKTYDWLWKVMLYGNIIDFYFVKRLKSMSNVNNIISENNLTAGQGIEIGLNGNKDTDFLKDLPFLDTKKKTLERYYINTKQLGKWIPRKVHRNRATQKQIFSGPQLLFKFGLTTSFQAVTSYSDSDLVFLKSITAIKGNKSQAKLLKNLVGLFNSKLFQYYILSTGSSTGIEREQAHNEDEKFTFPVIIDPKIPEKVDLIIKNKLNDKLTIFDTPSKKINQPNTEALEIELNTLIDKLYNISDTERDLMSYCEEVTIKLIRGSSIPLNKASEKTLKEYTKVFLDHFAPLLKSSNEFLLTEIYNKNPYLIAINFKIIDTQPQVPINFNTEQNVDSILNLLGKISLNKISNHLYMQKDVKGIERNSFYILKTHEFKNWHPAIARLDLNEFMSAMLKSEINRYQGVK